MNRFCSLLFSSVPFLILFACTEETLIYDYDIQLQTDIQAIDEYLSESEVTANVHESGMRFTIIEEGDGGFAPDQSYFNYCLKVSRLDGDNFFSIDKPAPLPYFEINWQDRLDLKSENTKLMQCLHEATSLIQTGGHARLYVPSGLAFRHEGQHIWVPEPNGARSFHAQVPANTNLIIEATLVEVTTYD